MNKIRRITIRMVSVICLLVLFAFVRSIAPTYIESSRTAYEINGMRGGIDSKRFNSAITNYTKRHHVSAIKVFNVQTVNDTGATQTKMYVLGDAKVPKESLASKQEMQTSDIRYPLYFVGNVSQKSIQRMFKRNRIQYSSINESWNWGISNFLNTNQISSILILAFLVMGIVIILANLHNLKKANIRNLLGMSNFDDAFDTFVDDQGYFLSSYLLGIILLMIYMWISKFMNCYRIVVYFALLLYLIVILVTGVAAILRAHSHSERTIIGAIKGNVKNKLAFYINMIIKIVVEIFACLTFVTLLGTLKQNQQLSNQLSVWTHGKTYYTVNLSPIDTTKNEDIFLEHGSTILFHYIEEHGGMLANYQGWGTDKTDVMNFSSGHVLTVNPNYLKTNSVLAFDGKRVRIPNKTRITYVLIPEAQYANRSQILREYRSDLWLNSAEHKTGKKLPIKAIKIKNSQRPFTYSADALDFGYYDGYVNSPVVLVLTNESLGGISKNNTDANSIWPSYLSNEAFLSSNVSAMRKAIQKSGMSHYIGGIVDTKSYAIKQLTLVRRKLEISIAVLVITLTIIIIENISFNSIYFNNNRKKIAIKRLLGSHFISIFGKFINLNLILSLFEAFIVWAITKNMMVTILLLGLSNIGELLILSIQNHYLNINKAIKGE